MLTAQRRNDAVIVACQDNAKKSVEIKEINEAVRILTGFEESELIGETLEKILPDHIRGAIKDYLEFGESGSDLAEVMGKVRDFSLRTRDGELLPLKFKIFRVESEEKTPRFQILMRDESLAQEIESSRQQAGYEIIDELTKLPNQASFEKDLELIVYYVGSRGMDASFAIIAIDEFSALEQTYSHKIAQAIVQSVAHLCKSKLRGEDTIGYLGGGRFALTMTGANADGARIVLNRLRWLVSSNKIEADGHEIYLTISAGFCEIRKDHQIGEIFGLCETALKWAMESGGDFVQEAS